MNEKVYEMGRRDEDKIANAGMYEIFHRTSCGWIVTIRSSWNNLLLECMDLYRSAFHSYVYSRSCVISEISPIARKSS